MERAKSLPSLQIKSETKLDDTGVYYKLQYWRFPECFFGIKSNIYKIGMPFFVHGYNSNRNSFELTTQLTLRKDSFPDRFIL